MTYIVPKRAGDRSQPGPWWHPLTGPYGERWATIRCPGGHVGSISEHTIRPSGKVEPSVVCPFDGCGFHEHVMLEGWTEG